MVNVECKCNKEEKPNPSNYPRIENPAPDLSPNDGRLVIVNSEIMCGVMDKATVGGKKKSIFGVIMRDYGPHQAAAAMNRLAKVCARWLGSYRTSLMGPRFLIYRTASIGFSLGINDVIPGPILSGKKESLVQRAYSNCLDLITLAKKGRLENKPGCDQEQTLEAMISSVLSQVRDKVGKHDPYLSNKTVLISLGEICMRELSRHNAPLIMATCGSKGWPVLKIHLRARELDLFPRFCHQRVPDGRVCWTTNYCGS
jgi:DNA-directed RNA polymerase III subunit RPC1